MADKYQKESCKKKSPVVKQIDDFLEGKVDGISEPSLLKELKSRISDNFLQK